MNRESPSVGRFGLRAGEREYSCFLSAPARANLQTLRTELERKSIRSIVLSELPSTTGSILEDVTQAISDAELFIAVLDGEHSNPNVLFELGCAYTLRKRILVVASPTLRELPSDIAGLPSVRADTEDGETLAFALDQFLISPKGRRRAPGRAASTSQPIDQHYAQELTSRLGDASERVLQEVVASAMRASGIKVIVNSALTKPSTTFDLAIWSNELDVSVGNPLPIEVKAKLRDREEAIRVRSTVQSYLRRTGSRTALVLYLEGLADAPDFTDLSLPDVLFLGIRELLQRLQVEGFSDLIRAHRNRVAHGAAA